MTTRSITRVLFCGLAITCWMAASVNADDSIRAAQMAGSWYPDDRDVLAETVDAWLAGAGAPEVSEKPLAIISPHAGYPYSGKIAAAGYRYLQGRQYKRVFVLAFSHRNASRYQGVDVPREFTAYETPLGRIMIDREVCDALLKSSAFLSQPGIDQGEHSLELQLPFLQRTIGDFKLVPLYVGRMDIAKYTEAARAILPFLGDDVLLVASSDFTHYGPRFHYVPFSDDVPKKIEQLGNQAAEGILHCDFDGFANHLAKTGDTICGRGPVALLLRILSMRGGAETVRAGFDTSGRITGDWTNSVTYQSFVFTKRQGSLEPPIRSELLRLARRTVEAHLRREPLPEVKLDEAPEILKRPGACFVTLENHGRLRGCIGNMTADRPLWKAVSGNAVLACQDRRFVNDPVTAAELPDLHIEISYLSPMKPVKSTDEIIVGRHGLLISMGLHRGVLLPQVAYERGWTREEFLRQTCRKAGLPLDAWQRPESTIYLFESEVFGEPEGPQKGPGRSD